MKTIKNITLALLAALLLSSCEDINVRETEQYIKQVYLVGSLDVVWSFDIPYGAEPQEAYISVATSGSLNIDQDVTVKLRHNDAVIDWYNHKYLYDAPVKYRQLEASKYTIPAMETTIKAGDVYSRLPFTINTTGLHCDSLYAMTFEIESVSRYEKNTVDSVIILNFNLINEFTGVYQLSATRYSLTSNGQGGYNANTTGTLSASRTLKAVDANTVRFFNEARAETRGGYASNEAYFAAINAWCVTFTRDAGNNFRVEPWGTITIHDGECSYADGTFSFWYDFQDGNNRYRIEGTLTK